jgi:MFS family permease
MLTFNPEKKDIYGLIISGFGLILPLVILFVSERPDEFFVNVFMLLLLLSVPILGLLMSIFGRHTTAGKIGIGFGAFVIFVILFFAFNSQVTSPNRKPPPIPKQGARPPGGM